MSEAYERERQNNSRLEELASKVSTLRGVTVDIYDHASDQASLDNSNELFSSLSTSLRSSASRLSRMAQQGNRPAILKLAAIICATALVIWWIWSLRWHG